MRQHSSVRHYFSVSNPASRSTTDDCHFFSTHNWSTVPRAELAVPGLRFNFACSGGEGVRGDKHQRIQNFHRRLFWSLVGRTTNCGAWIEEMGQKEGWWPGEDFCQVDWKFRNYWKGWRGQLKVQAHSWFPLRRKSIFFKSIFVNIWIQGWALGCFSKICVRHWWIWNTNTNTKIWMGLKMRRSVVVCWIKGCGGCPGGGLLSHFASAVKTPFQPGSNCTSAPSTTRPRNRHRLKDE